MEGDRIGRGGKCLETLTRRVSWLIFIFGAFVAIILIFLKSFLIRRLKEGVNFGNDLGYFTFHLKLNRAYK